jgi:hypothetical protein
METRQKGLVRTYAVYPPQFAVEAEILLNSGRFTEACNVHVNLPDFLGCGVILLVRISS